MRLKITLEYDGTDFHGWQVQPGLRTVQGCLEEALTKIMGTAVRVTASGRTDAGVHALAQTVHCDVPRDIPPENIGMGLNSTLPRDVRVTRCQSVEGSFHARFHARSKVYRYLILNRRTPTALMRNRVWHIREPLEIQAMRAAARHLKGKRDFAAFKSSGEDTSTVREMRRLHIVKDGDFVILTYEADGFLKHMVRNITGALVEVGKGRLAPVDVKRLLADGSRDDAPRKAPAQGLTLVEVHY